MDRNTVASYMRRKLVRAAKWIKLHSHQAKVLGGVIFSFALLFGIIWLCGPDVEAVVVVLGLLSSTCFALPSIADYFFPERKPIRNMSCQEILDFIPTTDPNEDWAGISLDGTSQMFLKEDPQLRFIAKYTDDGIQQKDFREPWANGFLHRQATGFWHDLYYAGSFLDRINLVAVDDAAVLMPTPDMGTTKIRRYWYHVAKIHDRTGKLDSYIDKAGLSVKPS